MADSEKGNSSTGDAKVKMSLLDEDFSKDFLSSWKSGGDDMDFNFEPVSKGKKKAFDFGMDMDFSLDDAFGKMSSFKMDMPDLDFSNPPNKSTKSKDKSEEDSAKGNHQDKHDKFTFSFDFNGLDDFSLGAPSDKGGKSPSTEKKSKKDGSNSEDLSIGVINDKTEATEEFISSEPQVCEDAALSKPEDLIGDGISDARSGNCASKSVVLSHPVQPKETQTSSDTKLAENTHKRDHQNNQEGETSEKSWSSGREPNIDLIPINKPPRSIGSLMPMPVESAEVHRSSGMEIIMTALSTDDEIQLNEKAGSNKPLTQLNEIDPSTNVPSVEASTQVNVSDEMGNTSPNRNPIGGSSEGGIVIGELSTGTILTSETEKLMRDKSSPQCSINNMTISDGKKDPGDGGILGCANLPLDTVNRSATSDMKALSHNARSSAEMQNPALKVSLALLDRGPTSTKIMLLKNKVPAPITDGGGTEASASEDNQEGLTPKTAVDRSSYGSSKHNGKNSCTEELIQSYSVMEKSKKTAAAHTPPRDPNDTANGKSRTEVSINTVTHNGKASVNTVPHNGKAAKVGLSPLECERMINNVKLSGLKVPSPTPPEQETKVGNQGQGNLKEKIPSITLRKKLNVGEGHKLSSQRIDKKIFALPTLKITRSTTSDKNPAAPTKLSIAKSLASVGKSTGLQAMAKTVSPITEKQTPSTPSLKRKPYEVADMGPAKLHMPKRVSPSESRMSEVSARELEDGAQRQGNFLEGSRKNVSAEYRTPKFAYDQEANMAALQFSLMVENDANVEKAEACAKELNNICNMLKKKHEEAKELLVRALVNNNHLLMLSHPIYEEKIRAVQSFASKLMSKELEVEG